MLHESKGTRLKRLVKEHGLTREDMSEILYCTPGHITRYYNGTTPLPEDRAELLSNIWGIRKEYILGLDDFKTDEEMYEFANATAVSDMKVTLDYLESLDLILRPCTAMQIELKAIYRNISEAEKYIKTDSLECLKRKYDFTLSTSQFCKKYFSEECLVELSSPIPNTPYFDGNDFSGKTKAENDSGLLGCSNFVSSSDEQNPFHINFEIVLFFKTYYQKKFVRTCSISEVQNFVSILKSYSVFSVENMLINKASAVSSPSRVFSTIDFTDS